MNWIARIVGWTAGALLLGPALLAPAASAAGPEPLTQFGVGNEGTGAGQTQIPRGIASDPRTGHVFVADQTNKRVDEFTAWGAFIKAFGWDVAPGAVNESQEVRFRATAGQFELTFGASTTAPLQFDAGAKAVEEALDGLSSIGGAGGEVSVGFNPSNSAGASPYVYVLTFKGALAATDVAQVTATDLSLSGGVPSTGLEASTRANGTSGGTGLEACTTESGCRKGAQGPGAGQFGGLGSPQGVAIDSSGDVYVADRGNQRVQKFSPAGEFLRMWGKGVNTGTGANKEICTDAGPPTDVCGAGGEGAGNGQFGAWAILGSYITVGPANKVYVGDVGRIQVFNAEGEYQSQISAGIVAGERIKSLAVDPSGNLYASLCAGECGAGESPKPNVREWSPSGTYLGETVTAAAPFALATDSAGDLYAVSGESNPTIFEFNPAHAKIAEFGKGEFGASTGIGANAAGDVYVANSLFSNSFIRAYGPEPSALEPPPDSKPDIGDEYATSVGTTSAVLKATIAPHFWSTRYFVQYGPEECEAALVPCAEQPLPPGSALGAKRNAAGATVAIEGLLPGRVYHFRFVAESEAPSSIGHPTLGADGSFRTFPTPAPNTSCANQALRAGLGALLSDCRGYEMVSPVDKNGGDADAYEYEGFAADNNFKGLDQSTPGGAKLAYTASTAFAGSASSPFVSQYIATRHEGAGGSGSWLTEAISPPERGGGVNYPNVVENEYKAFSPDLSTGWLVPESGNPLAPCATEGYKNLYRAELGPPPTYTALCSAAPEAPKCTAQPRGPLGCYLFPEIEGYSADQSHAVFRVNDRLIGEAAALGRFPSQLYEWDEGALRLVSVLPDGSAYEGSSTAGSESAGGTVFGFNGNFDTVEHAVSADGRTVYWTAAPGDELPGVYHPGPLYVRTEADRPQSALAAPGSGASGSAGGLSGGLTAGSTTVTKLIAAKGTATLSEGSNELTALFTGFPGTGKFVAGQPIKGTGIPAGTTVVSATPTTLRLSAAVAAGKSGTKVPIESEGPAPFAVGQRIVGAGIPPQTTIAAVGTGTLTLSAAATQLTPLGLKTPLSAFSECGEADKACTVPVWAEPAQFWDAKPDGSEAIFSVLEGPEAGSLYRYDLAKEEATRIAKRTQGVLGASADLSYLYFSSEEALPGSGENSEGATAQPNRPNVYLDHEGAFSFVGTLVGGDINPGSPQNEQPSPVASVPRSHVARVSADGRHLAFVSAAKLTGYDNADSASGEADREVYLYEAGEGGGAGRLLCASCNPSGSRPAGADLQLSSGSPLWTAAWINSYQFQLYGRRMLSEDGSRLFFNSVDALSPRDTNGAQDVYEWEAPGAGPAEAKCTKEDPTFSAQDEGCVSLISSGESPKASEFVDASASGADVFFRTESSLSPQDPGAVDIYDARVGGGEPRPEEGPVCEGDSCQSPPGAPGLSTPASAAFQGPGNSKQPPGRKPCPKGKRKARGQGKARCVPKHKKQHKKNRAKRAGAGRGAGR